MKYLTFYEKTILNNIEGFESYNIVEPTENLAKIKEVYTIFKSEYVQRYNRHLAERVLFKEWLQGLPTILSVPYYNSEILKNASLEGFKLETEEQEDNFLAMYFERLSIAFFNLKDNL